MKEIREIFEEVFYKENLVKMIFGNKRRKSIEYNKVMIRPVVLGGQLKFQVEYTFPKKVTHENLTADEALNKALSLTEEDFKQINIFTESGDIQILAAKTDKPKIIRKGATKVQKNLDHNHTKKYVIPDGRPCDFLIHLGVMGEDGKVFQKHYGKFRQINRYLEIVEDVFPYLPAKADGKPLKIIDFGCGKAYLTFAIYYYLKVLKNRDVEIIGLDLKEDVIDFCSKVAAELGYDELKFLKGDIADYTNDHADMVVTLHACDTATDYALMNAVAWNTKVILSVPCCQHELFSQIKNDIHDPMLKYGILKDRLTEYLTDGLRGLKLETKGYDVAMIEFTSLEHTARNIMIKAVKSDITETAEDPRQKAALRNAVSAKAARAQRQYEALRDFYQVNPTIDKL